MRAVVVLVSHGQAFAAIGPFDSREEADAYANARNAHQSVRDLQGHVVPLTERELPAPAAADPFCGAVYCADSNRPATCRLDKGHAGQCDELRPSERAMMATTTRRRRRR